VTVAAQARADVSGATVIAPNPGPQERFLATPADIAFFGGEAGGGKTAALLLECLRHVDNPGHRATIFRRTHPRITEQGGLWETSEEFFPHLGAEPYKSPHYEWRFPSGAKVAFRAMQHAKDRHDWKGAQIPLICWDQAEEFEEVQFWYLLSRNRSVSGVRPYVRATCNPVPDDDDTGGWVHRLLSWWIGEDGYPVAERDGVLRWFLRHDGDLAWFDAREEALAYRDHHGLPSGVEPKSLTFIRSRLEDNPVLMRQDPGYLSTLEALPKIDRDRLRGGNWNVRAAAGEVFDRAWFEVVDAAPAGLRAVRYWDKAGTEGGGAQTAGVLMAGPNDGLYWIVDVTAGRWSALERERTIEQVATSDGKRVDVWVEQEPGSGGKESAEATIRRLSGHTVRADRVTGSKLERAMPLSAQAEAGNVNLVRGPWNEAFLTQAHSFDGESGDMDLIDAAAGAFNKLTAVGSGHFYVGPA